MGGPFDRTGTNTADEVVQPTTQTGDVEDRGVIFGPTDDITINTADAASGQASDSGVLFGPTDAIDITPLPTETGTFEDSGIIFGGRLGITGVPVTPGGGADGNTTYDLTRTDEAINLVGSNGTTDTVTPVARIPSDANNAAISGIRIGDTSYRIVGGSGAEDDRTDLERFRTKINDADTERRFTFTSGVPNVITYDIDGEIGNVVGNFTFVNGLPERVVYTGALVDSITNRVGGEFIKRFVFNNGLPQRIIWQEITGALLTLTDDGWLSDSTGTATLTDDGWFTADGWEVTDDGYLMEAS